MSSRLINLAMLAGAASGPSQLIDRAARGYLTAQLSEEFFFRFASKLQVNFLLECGANAAETSIRFATEMKGKAIAIEANPATFESRTSKAADKGVIPICTALGDEKGQVELMVPKEGRVVYEGASSLLRRDDDLAYDTYQVEKDRLDSIIKDFEVGKEDQIALWLDVEGLALEVLNGAENFIQEKNIVMLFVEVESEAFWKEQKTATDIDDFLSKHKFTPVIRDIQSAGQFNLLYVRDDLLDECDELIIDYWRNFNKLGLGWKYKLISLKKKLTSNPHSLSSKLVHFVGFLLGSSSSRKALFGGK